MPTLVRESYIRHRTLFMVRKTGHWDPYVPPAKYEGASHRGIRTRPIWVVIADFMLTHQLHFDRCIDFRFRSLDIKHTAPEPNQIASRDWLEDYRLVTRNVLTAVATELESQTAIYTRAVYAAPTEDQRQILAVSSLVNATLELSPLFRYCMAKRLGLKPIAARYQHNAVMQYIMATKAYDKAWAKVLPEGFSGFANAAWRKIAGYEEDS